MEKKYCIHCNTLTHEGERCNGCGKNEFQKIVISVQSGRSQKDDLQ